MSMYLSTFQKRNSAHNRMQTLFGGSNYRYMLPFHTSPSFQQLQLSKTTNTCVKNEFITITNRYTDIS